MSKTISNEARNIMEKHRTVTKYGYTVDSDQFLSAVTELADARSAKVETNKERIEELQSQITEITTQRNKYADSAKDMEKLNRWYSVERRDAWKTISKKLNIHQFLTNNGGFSKAKVMKKFDPSTQMNEINKIVQTYNKDYVQQMNDFMTNVQDEYDSKLVNLRSDINEYNRLGNEANRLIKEQNALTTL